jgi:WD40 repeat protein
MKLDRAVLVLAAGLLSGLALVAGAAGTTATHGKVRHLQVPIAALAIDGSRIAYDASAKNVTKPHATNRVLVWNVRTGKTVKVSGAKTAVSDDVVGGGVLQLAIAGRRVAWLLNEGGNLESDDYLFTSSVASPKERKVASALRSGESCGADGGSHCAGPWLGGLVGSGNLIAMNRWTTDGNGTVTDAQLDVLSGTKLKQAATGANTLQADAADGGRVAVLHSDGAVAVYSNSGQVLMTLPPASAKEAALDGKNLVVVSETRQLQVYDSSTGSLKKTLPTHGRGLHNLDVQGNIAIYTTGPSVRAVNLSSGKTRAVVTLGKHSEILFARISSAGMAYALNSLRAFFGKGTLGFVPMARLKAAVG